MRALVLLKRFLKDKTARNAWLESKDLRVYVRKSRRLLNTYALHDCLDIATLEITESKQRKGLGSGFIRQAPELNPYEYTYLENVLNPGFLKHLTNAGWFPVNTESLDTCLYRPVMKNQSRA